MEEAGGGAVERPARRESSARGRPGEGGAGGGRCRGSPAARGGRRRVEAGGGGRVEAAADLGSLMASASVPARWSLAKWGGLGEKKRPAFKVEAFGPGWCYQPGRKGL